MARLSRPWGRLPSKPHSPYLSLREEASSAREMAKESPGSALDEVPLRGPQLCPAQLAPHSGAHCSPHGLRPQP